MERFFVFVIDCGLLLYTLFVSVVIILYVGALFQKITEPHYKNLRYEEFGWLALIVVPLALLEFLVVRHFFRKLKKKIATGPHGWR
jgi:hypothetical protein